MNYNDNDYWEYGSFDNDDDDDPDDDDNW